MFFFALDRLVDSVRHRLLIYHPSYLSQRPLSIMMQLLALCGAARGLRSVGGSERFLSMHFRPLLKIYWGVFPAEAEATEAAGEVPWRHKSSKGYSSLSYFCGKGSRVALGGEKISRKLVCQLSRAKMDDYRHLRTHTRVCLHAQSH